MVSFKIMYLLMGKFIMNIFYNKNFDINWLIGFLKLYLFFCFRRKVDIV